MKEEKEILDGFNAGYIIEQHHPDLFKQVESALEGTELPFFKGFLEGGQEYSRERARVKLLDSLKKLSPQPPSNREKDLGKDDVGFEPEI